VIKATSRNARKTKKAAWFSWGLLFLLHFLGAPLLLVIGIHAKSFVTIANSSFKSRRAKRVSFTKLFTGDTSRFALQKVTSVHKKSALAKRPKCHVVVGHGGRNSYLLKQERTLIED